MYCTNCGKKNDDQSRYCEGCGTALRSKADTRPSMEGKAGKTSLVARMLRAAKLEAALYDEVKSDFTANRQTFIIVAMCSLAAGLTGGLLAVQWESSFWFSTDAVWLRFVGHFLISLVWWPIGWLLVSSLAYWLGTKVLCRGRVSGTYGGVLRTMGFARSPSILGILTFIPFLGGLIGFCMIIWIIAAEIIALRRSLSLSTGQAIGLWALSNVPVLLLGSALGAVALWQLLTE